MAYEKEMRDYADQMKEMCVRNDTISDELFKQYGVNR